MKKDIIYGSLLILCILAFFYAWDRGNKSKDAEARKDSVIAEKNAIISYHKNKLGETVSQKNAAEMTTKELTKAYPLLIAEIKKEFDLKVKDIRAIVRDEFIAHGQGNSTINNHYYIDSTGIHRSTWDLKISDGYLNCQATFIDSLHVPYSYTYGDTATTVVHAERKWFLGSETLYSSSVFKNPNAKVIGTTNILVKNYKDKRWALSVGVSYLPLMYNEKIQYQIQPSVQFGYTLFKF